MANPEKIDVSLITGSQNPLIHDVDGREGKISEDYANAVREVEHPTGGIHQGGTQSQNPEAHAS